MPCECTANWNWMLWFDSSRIQMGFLLLFDAASINCFLLLCFFFNFSLQSVMAELVSIPATATHNDHDEWFDIEFLNICRTGRLPNGSSLLYFIGIRWPFATSEVRIAVIETDGSNNQRHLIWRSWRRLQFYEFSPRTKWQKKFHYMNKST